MYISIEFEDESDHQGFSDFQCETSMFPMVLWKPC